MGFSLDSSGPWWGRKPNLRIGCTRTHTRNRVNYWGSTPFGRFDGPWFCKFLNQYYSKQVEGNSGLVGYNRGLRKRGGLGYFESHFTLTNGPVLRNGRQTKPNHCGDRGSWKSPRQAWRSRAEKAKIGRKASLQTTQTTKTQTK